MKNIKSLLLLVGVWAGIIIMTIIGCSEKAEKESVMNIQGSSYSQPAKWGQIKGDISEQADLINQTQNYENLTNKIGSFCFQIISNTAPFNYAQSAPLQYPITITNISAWEGNLVGFNGDLYTAGITNPASRTLVYTGATYTATKVAATNLPATILIPAGRILGAVITNGAITNAFIMGQYTW